MLEALSPAELRLRLGFDAGGETPNSGSIASSARGCVRAWRTPPRQRVTTYLLRQLAAMGYDEGIARDAVRDVLDRLIAIGDFVPVRLDGKASIVLAMPAAVEVAPGHIVLLGEHDDDDLVSDGLLARHRPDEGDREVMSFGDWIGRPAFEAHHLRRGGMSMGGSLADYWALLASAVRHEGLPISVDAARIVSAPPNAANAYFGRHSDAMPSGRWSNATLDGTYCGVRPGRNEHHWNPIILLRAGGQDYALDLHDWDEWNWALLARGIAQGAPERHRADSNAIAFEHPIPMQYQRALTLLGTDGGSAWTWVMTPEASACFQSWIGSFG
ncbi:MAG: hypothetical protein ACREB7_06600 [Sphingopyxis sp.]|uniref:hypothetical protein n=1 Tax=Sphingopyxis sp. TaxID=1908224 RepID=UPI003D6C95CA